jgi:hypothetical protein
VNKVLIFLCLEGYSHVVIYSLIFHVLKFQAHGKNMMVIL